MTKTEIIALMKDFPDNEPIQIPGSLLIMQDPATGNVSTSLSKPYDVDKMNMAIDLAKTMLIGMRIQAQTQPARPSVVTAPPGLQVPRNRS